MATSLHLARPDLLVDRMLIGGAWCDADGGATVDVADPATGERIGGVPDASAADTERAIQAAEAPGALKVFVDV